MADLEEVQWGWGDEESELQQKQLTTLRPQRRGANGLPLPT